ncbi:hypothetical protein LWS69_11990 [Bordetella hinzii]|nr:hypothetical protein [Bordetella hinzii]
MVQQKFSLSQTLPVGLTHHMTAETWGIRTGHFAEGIKPGAQGLMPLFFPGMPAGTGP